VKITLVPKLHLGTREVGCVLRTMKFKPVAGGDARPY
jgi:hypothetical protein